MKSIILIQPKAGSFDMLGARLPIGILSIAALPIKEGYEVKLIDQRIDHNWKRTLMQELKSNPLCVGITCMTGKQILYALEASEIVKQNSNVPVIWGGIHPTLLTQQTLANPNIDIIILREGDITFLELIKALENGSSIDKVEGICYKKAGKQITTKERPFIKKLDELPDLPYELVDLENYSTLNIEGKSLDFISSRGCPYRCSFCYNNYFNKSIWRALSAKETVSRIENLHEKHNVKTIYFQDDNFCANLKRLEEICKLIIKEKLDIRWGALGLRVDTAKRMDANFLKLMQKSGCVNVDVGVESGSKRVLGLIDKKITVPDTIAVNKKLARFPFIIKYTFIIGFPTETKREMLATIKLSQKLARENKNAYTPYSVYTPYPGTSMYNMAIDNGFEPPKKLEEWGKFSMDDWYFNFKSWLSQKEIRELKSIAFTSLFSNRNVRYKINNTLPRILFDLYYPIAKFRFFNNFHKFPIDSLLGKKLLSDKI